MVATADEHDIDLAQRAYELAQGIKQTFGPAGIIGQSAANHGLPSPALMAAQQLVATGQLSPQAVPHYMVQGYPPPRPPDPLDAAINDVSVSIYEVIRLAEERA